MYRISQFSKISGLTVKALRYYDQENILQPTFRNEDNGFTVLTLSSGKEDITCTGNFGYIGQGEYVEIEGEEVFHEIYGKQIKAIN